MGGIKNIQAVNEPDQNASDRKSAHIDLALDSKVSIPERDSRFNYEPLLSGHPDKAFPQTKMLGKNFSYPIWVSSMTGGTALAGRINENLARVCKEFGLGMGLGSCRQLLYSDTYLKDFQLREYIGDQPLYANLGIAQLEKLVQANDYDKINRLIDKLQADGLIIHINPLQEWMQPEGDKIEQPPIETIEKLLENLSLPVIVKEVGQGMGPESLRRLLQLPLEAIDFAALGGTNFTRLEQSRNTEMKEDFGAFTRVGHTAEEMTRIVNEYVAEGKTNCRQLIISGGINNFLDGYYLVKLSKLPAIYGQASQFLKYAMDDYDSLYKFVAGQAEGLDMANAFLTIRQN